MGCFGALLTRACVCSGVLHVSRPGGSRQEVPQRNEALWVQHLQENLRPRRQSGAAHERSLAGTPGAEGGRQQ